MSDFQIDLAPATVPSPVRNVEAHKESDDDPHECEVDVGHQDLQARLVLGKVVGKILQERLHLIPNGYPRPLKSPTQIGQGAAFLKTATHVSYREMA